MDTVIYFGQGTLLIPFLFKPVVFFGFETLIFFNKQQLISWANAHTKVESYIFMGIGASITTCFCSDSDSACLFNPLFTDSTKLLLPEEFLIVPNSV